MAEKSEVDFKLATIRRDCLIQAVELCKAIDDAKDVIGMADEMYRFVIGETASMEKENGWK